MRLFALTLACAILLSPAVAAPPPNADPALAPWFQSLKQPGSGSSCCSISDCRIEPYRQTAIGYEVLLDGEWIRVPDDKVLQQIEITPAGRSPAMPGRGSSASCASPKPERATPVQMVEPVKVVASLLNRRSVPQCGGLEAMKALGCRETISCSRCC